MAAFAASAQGKRWLEGMWNRTNYIVMPELVFISLFTGATQALIVLLMLIFLLGLALSALALKYAESRQKIAQKEKEIENQNAEIALKNYGLRNIDWLMETQERERLQVSEVLRENLGSLLATIKLNFENIKKRGKNLNEKDLELYSVTDQLIEKAYQNVLNMSDIKNAGVIGLKGLVEAVQNMCTTMAETNNITFNVFPFGLEHRLDNHLQLALFRMIQELVLNVVKHSEATEASIYLTQHSGHEVNVIIEDNGNGFEARGMDIAGKGLKFIEKTSEQMGGDFTIDSIVSKGTTVIINIPIHDPHSNSRRPSVAY